MTLQSSARPDGIAHHHRALGGWTTTWTDGPPSDWDEIRDRLRSLHPPKGGPAKSGRRQEARRPEPEASRAVVPEAVALDKPMHVPLSLTLELVDGTPPARVSWRRADPVVPSALVSLWGWLRAVVAAAPLAHWWREHDPLLVQRVLLLVNALLILLLVISLV